ncbi:MAG: aldehyde dehydrogenase family protein [Sphingobium sp.]
MTQDHVDKDAIARIFKAQRANRVALKRRDATGRIERLQILRDIIVRRTPEIDEALHRDLRKVKAGARNGEIAGVLGDIDTAVASLADWMQPERIEPSPHFAGNETYVQYEPRGVVLLYGAWNFPFAMVFSPLVPIIAAGNACIVKPNELQPHTSSLVAEIIAEAFPENEVACLEGGVALAEALGELPFDHVFLTGSPAVGKRVMAAAAKHLSSVTLELGGKCPAILDDDYPIADAAAKIVGARFLNAGQLCLSVDHVWVPKAREAELVATLGAVIDQMFYVDGVLQRERLSRLVDARNFARVNGYVEDAVARGATVAKGGASDEADLTIEPTIVLDPPLDAHIMQEEIFGPILPVIGYENVDDVVEQIDETGKPLALYVFSHDQAFVDDVLDRSSSGGVTVNNVLMHYAESKLPFGGVNGSGIGRYKGVHGFHELSNARSGFVQKT